MRIATLDFETFWSTTHSLSKMSPIEYVMHPETELISCSIKVNDYPTDVFFGEAAISHALHRLDWSDTLVIGHNMSMFDALILAWRLGIRPKMWGCTLAMARPLHGNTIGLSLGKLVQHYGIGVKNNAALVNTKGKHLCDFTEAERQDMKVYNRDDTEQCYALFKKLYPQLPRRELWVIDGNIRMMVEPRFELNVPLLQTALSREQAKKRKTQLALAAMLGIEDTGDADKTAAAVSDVLMSAAKFSALLAQRNVDVPLKPSPKDPEKLIPALAKSDDAFMELMDHEDDIVAAAAAARLEAKSTLLETRIQSFLRTGEAVGGRLPIPARYYGAHTGRDSGELYNALNLPRINWNKDGTPVPKLTNALRMSLMAPKGHVVIVADKSGIEMRLNHHLWRVPYSMELWKKDAQADIYKATAAKYYNITEAEVQGPQRQFGKVLQLACFSATTRVLTDSGVKPIVNVLVSDKVWDGITWVSHGGVICRGMKSVVAAHGLEATEDHEILTGRGWAAWSEVHTNPSLFQSALSLANLPSLNGPAGSARGNPESTWPSSGARAGMKVWWRAAVSKAVGLRAATDAPRKHPGGVSRTTGSTPTLSLMTHIAAAYSTALPQLFSAVTGPERTRTTERAESPSATSGAATGGRSSNTLLRWMDGMTLRWKWTARTTTGGTPRGISALLAGRRTCATGAERTTCPSESSSSKKKTPVYDLLFCGPNSRFAVITDAGPLIVHNCGFQIGAKKFKTTAWTMGRLRLDDAECENGVQGWRQLHPEISDKREGGWARCQEALKYIMAGQRYDLDPWGFCHTSKEGIHLPDGRIIRYPNLRAEVNPKTGYTEYKYGDGRHTKYIYGGKVDENVIQALGRTILMDDKEQFYRDTGLLSQLQVYDELAYVVPEKEAESLLAHLQSIMRKPPKWWPELVVWSEGDMAPSYGLAK